MSSSVAESTRPDAADERTVALERSIERLNQGIVVSYELTTDTDEPVAVQLTQRLPPKLETADVGFRTDAAPSEWTVEGDTVRGTGTVPEAGDVEYVLGLKLPEAPDELPDFPSPDLSPDDESDGGDETTATEGETDDSPDGRSLVGDPDGALAESVREVIGDDETDSPADGDDGTPDRTAATDGGTEAATAATEGAETPAPRQDPTGSDADLEEAVAAVASDLDEGDESLASPDEGDAETDEGPELELSVPDPDTEGNASVASTGDATNDGSAVGGEPATATTESDVSVEALADRLAAADETERRAVREALGLDDGPDTRGTVSARLENLESRLSAFEAYEDALADFIDDTGTVEDIEATATEAAAAADELRTEVADLQEEVTAAREAVETANEERAALREDLDALRADVDEALGLRQQLLTALQNAGADP